MSIIKCFEGTKFEDQIQLFDNKSNNDVKIIELLKSWYNDIASQMSEINSDSIPDTSELDNIIENINIKQNNNNINREQIITDLLANYSYVVEINTTKDERVLADMRFEGELPNTNYYQGMTVPGGTNYTENEIATPAITPSIKGHAQFATDNGIGWFRSDEQGIGGEEYQRSYWDSEKNEEVFINDFDNTGIQATKTRRILEVQSDLFQKDENKEDLESAPNFQDRIDNGEKWNDVTDSLNKRKGNQFLQLLNQKGNWVTFFIKSIVQDSAKKGYEKVLFPSGETAAKVEGHTIIADRLNGLNNRIEGLKVNYEKGSITKEVFETNTKKLEEERQEMKTQGLEKLAPIEAFYTNRVTNILNKLYTINEITDEYGNTWNEVDLSNEKSKAPIYLTKVNLNDLLSEKEPSKLTLEDLNSHEPFSDEEEHGTLNEFILFGNQEGKKTFTAVEILENIINNYNGFSPIGDELVEKAKYLVSVTKAKVKIINEDNMVAKDTFMQYHPDTNTISISLNKVRSVRPATTIHGFLHEVVHSVTVNAIINPVTTEQRMFSTFIEEAFKQYKKQESITSANQYGFTNSKEFVAEIFTNPVFQQTIKDLDTTASLWKQIVDFIRMLVGLPKSKNKIQYNNVIDEILKIAPTEQVFNKDKYGIFEFKNEDIKVDDKLTTFKTLDDKLEYTINKIEESLKSNIRSLEWSSVRTKDEKRLKSIEKYIKDFNDILSEVQEYRLGNQVQAVAVFVGKISANMNYIKTRLDKIDHTNKDEVKNVLRVYSEYLSTFSVVNNIEKVIADIRTEIDTQEVVTEADLSQIETVLQTSKGQYSFLEKRMYSVLKKGMAALLNDIKYFKEVEKKHRGRLSKEHKQSAIPEDKESWIIDKMQNRDAKLIQEDVDKAVKALIEDPSYDIMGADVMFSSAINVSSPLIQIMNQILYDIKNEKNEELQIKNSEISEVFEELLKEKGSSNPNDLYKNILQYDSNGQPFFLSDYSVEFYDKVHNKLKSLSKGLYDEKNKLYEDLSKIRNKNGLDSIEYLNKKKEISNFVKNKESEIEKLKTDNITFNKDGDVESINNKWKTDYSKLSAVELKTLNLIKERIEKSHKDTFGQMSLINYSFGTKFYELPKVTKSDFERILTDNGKGIIKDRIKDLTETRPDDIGYYSVINTDLENNRVYNLKVHYRDISKTFDHKNQSLDIMNLIRLETENGVMFRVRKENEFILHSLIEIAKNKDYYQKEGTSKLVNYSSKKYNIVNGRETNTYKMMNNMIEQKFYDMFNKSSIKLNKLDLNKAVKFINSSSAFLTLSLNLASGTANVLNANAQLFLESFLPIEGGFINASGIAKANRMYGNNMTAILQDLTNPINKSFVNQVNEIFDIKDSLNLTNSGFLRTNMVKAGFDRESLQVFQSSGEHWIQSVTVMAVLDGVKALNANGKYIDKDGKEVSKKNAASLLDMLEVDKIDGIIKMSDKVVYTTHSRLTKWNEGGKTNVDMLIRKKLYDTLGNYTQLDQPDVMRHWGGKLIMLYRKYLIPMGQARLRGWETSLKLKENLTDDEKRFSYALQEYEEGTYTTLVRFVRTALKDKHYWLLSKPNWDKLSDYEKHNIKRAVTEMALVYGMLPLVLALVKGLADGDDDEYLFFLAYQIRRLDTELSQYQSLSEMFKMMRSPIPSARLIETVMSTTGALLTPWNLGEEYEAGPNKGKNKFSTKIKKQIPVVKEFQRTYEGLLQYQESNVGTGL